MTWTVPVDRMERNMTQTVGFTGRNTWNYFQNFMSIKFSRNGGYSERNMIQTLKNVLKHAILRISGNEIHLITQCHKKKQLVFPRGATSQCGSRTQPNNPKFANFCYDIWVAGFLVSKFQILTSSVLFFHFTWF